MSRKKYHFRNFFTLNCRNLRCESIIGLAVATASFRTIDINRVFYSNINE